MKYLRYLTRHGETPREDVAAAVERVWTKLAADVDARHAGTWNLPGSRNVERGTWNVRIAAAAVLAAAIGTAILWPRAESALYRVVDGTAQAGDTIRTSGTGTQLALADGSRVEMRSQSELSLERADDGLRIRLRRGGIIVNAAKRRTGHLYVQTKDMTVSVVGTVFLVNAEDDGSRVAVIEGEVRVNEGRTETTLRPGQQVSTNRAVAARPVTDEIGWSRHSDTYRAMLATFDQGMALTAGPLAPLTNPAAFDQSGSAAVQGQPAAPRPQFEEVSVKQCDLDNLPPTPPGARGGGANSFYMSPGRTYALCMTLATIIRTAYNYGPYAMVNTDRIGPASRGLSTGTVYGLGEEDGRRIRGGPDWIREERYTIEAVADGASDAETMTGPMLRALLEKRFQLKAHVEMEGVPGFDMTVARGGLKIKAVDTSACEAFQPGVGLVPRTFKDVRNGQKPSCGLGIETNGPNRVIVLGAAPLATLASALSGPGNLGARVVDKTGIADRFNFVFEFVKENPPERRVVLPDPDNHPETTANVPRAANVFTAIEEQLGLRLVPSKASRPFVVVDHVERPGPN